VLKTEYDDLSINLKWSYISSHGFYTGFKATIIIENEFQMSAAILIHIGYHKTPKYSRNIEKVRKRRIIRKTQ